MRLLVTISLLLLVTPAAAHSWYTGIHNPVTQNICCGGDDCAPLDDREVTPVPGGYEVHASILHNGAALHVDEFVPNAQAQPAREGGQYHMCYWGGQIRCFFFPAPSY